MTDLKKSFQDNHLKYKLDNRKEFKLKIEVSAEELKALEWFMGFGGNEFETVEALVRFYIKRIEDVYRKEFKNGK